MLRCVSTIVQPIFAIYKGGRWGQCNQSINKFGNNQKFAFQSGFCYGRICNFAEYISLRKTYMIYKYI